MSPPVAQFLRNIRHLFTPRPALGIVGLVLVLTFAWNSLPAIAQAPTEAESGFSPAPYITHLTNEEGLAQNRANVITQDQRGFIWIGTSNGLSRFDGYTVTTFQHERENPDSLSGNNVLSLLAGTDGTLWVGTTDGGLTHYDPFADTFVRYTHNSPGGERDIGRLITYSIYQDTEGQIWFGGTANSPLSRLNPATGEVNTIRFVEGMPASPTGAVRDIQADDTGVLWLVTDSALLSYDPTTSETTTYTAPEGENQLSALTRDGAGNWWVVGGQALYRYDRSSGALVSQNDTIRGGRDVVSTRDGNLWVTTATSGLYEITPTTGAITRHFKAVPTDPHSLAEDVLNGLFQDQDGLLWIATANSGVDRFDPTPSGFAFYRYDPAQPEGVAQGAVGRVVGQGANRLWIVTNGVLNDIALDTGEVTTDTVEAAALPITALYPDSRGALWIGLADGRVLRRDIATGATIPITLPPPPPSDRPPPPTANTSRAVTTFLERADGTVMVGIARVGLYQIPPDADVAEYIPIANAVNGDGQAVPIPPNVTSFAPGPNATVWVGHGGGLLGQLIFTPLTLRLGMPFPELGSIEQVYTDSRGQTWLATPRGLARVDNDGRGVNLYSTADGLPSNNIVSMVEDEAGRLWLGTQNGLATFDPTTNAIQQYGIAEGMREREFLSQSAWRLEDGWLAFGGREGLTLFDPNAVTLHATPTVAFTDLRLFNDSVIPGEGSPTRETHLGNGCGHL